ncbi:putative oxygen-independent coproporphyrinogen III oxidase [Desulfitobacterium dichloroeliminans LMG P-21439]|uniref:Heme chaperone HemW n=1 Tax=Desulfitobacterium dichloroeliminans (strain LMG P-21439 / DCA1) TaxID=871963 RepID=L0FBM1_DESDL|nr:radical SAM family heme chaperone HemW [Desulfitobacterium dichloroeliminans]AGA70420.1 putative oxygen-independent coproporphyrinogen III oxidase [Desulfitobacterium dichloroeliminans LMG P-21439]
MPSLYVHVPFCIRKCAYCAFYSVPLQRAKVEDYLKGLNQEIALRQEEIPEEVSTLFMGGGTPTALSEIELETVFSLLKQRFNFAASAEKTIEANPGTLTAGKLHVLKDHGINRISLGVQSFNDTLLKRIGRIHGAQDIHDGVKMVREAGFHNLNLDLMFGLPGQSLEDWQKTLAEAIEIQPEHLSIYGLMIEENTPLELDTDLLKDLPGDDAQAEMYELGQEMLTKAGYLHYETSNYALPGHECRHNLGYWHGEEYLGLGPGAVSCLKNRRRKNCEDLALYREKLNREDLPIDSLEDESLTNDQQRSERIILGLRLAEGINLENFKKEFRVDLFELYPTALERYINRGVLRVEEGKFLKMNPEFWFVANSVLQEFV